MAARAKKRRVAAAAEVEKEEAVERRLEELLFGGEQALVERLQLGQQTNIGKSLLDDDSSDSEVENEAKSDFPVSKKAVWVDEEDEAEELVDMTHRFRKGLLKSTTEKTLSMGRLQQRLKEQFQAAMGGTPSWAENKEKKGRKDKKNVEDESDEDEDLLQKTGNFVTHSDSLPKRLLQIKHCRHANYTRPSHVKLTASQFHPAAQVIMTAGLDQSISLFQVDEKTNPKIQSIHLERFPVYKARFSADGEQVIATAINNKMFYMYNMMAGKIIPVYNVRGLEERKVKEFEVSPDGLFLLLLGTSGYLHLLSMKTKEFVGSMKINGRAMAATFSPDGSTIYAHSDDGAVYIWDVKSRKCLTRFIDEGCLRGMSIAVSRNGQYVACGSSSGIVNVYSQDTCLHQTKPKPVKVVRNLVTAVTSLAFNPTTEILAIASKSTDHAVKMIHIPSFTAFANFPVVGQRAIYLAQEMDFSPRSGFFSIATNRGKALLYRLKHYSDF